LCRQLKKYFYFKFILYDIYPSVTVYSIYIQSWIFWLAAISSVWNTPFNFQVACIFNHLHYNSHALVAAYEYSFIRITDIQSHSCDLAKLAQARGVTKKGCKFQNKIHHIYMVYMVLLVFLIIYILLEYAQNSFTTINTLDEYILFYSVGIDVLCIIQIINITTIIYNNMLFLNPLRINHNTYIKLHII